MSCTLRKRSRSRARLGFALASCLVLACTGQIEGSGSRSSKRAPSGGGAGDPAGGRSGELPPEIGPGEPIPPGELDPGRVTIRRLNRAEYNNTVRDLLATDLRPAD